MPAGQGERTDTELGRVLLGLRAFQWIIGKEDDPYTLLLRAASDDPHVLGRRIRDLGPLYRSAAGPWVTATHEVGAAALADPRLSPWPAPPGPPDGSDAEPDPWAMPALRDILPLEDAYLSMDRAEQQRLHDALGPAIAASAAGHGARAEDIFGRHALRAAAGPGARPGEFDLMTGFAHPAAVESVAVLLGLPHRDGHGDRLAALCAAAACAQDAVLCPPSLRTARDLMAALGGIRDLLTAMPPPWDAPADDALAVSTLVLVVGVATTATLICDAVAALSDAAGWWEALADDPGHADAVVEETLRYAPPVRLQRLFATGTAEVAGRPVETGDEIVVAIEAANRDPAVFAAPDVFDPGRTDAREHLSLRACSDTALVAPLVRAQTAAAVRALATRTPGTRPAGRVLRRLRSPVTGGVLRFPVTTR